LQDQNLKEPTGASTDERVEVSVAAFAAAGLESAGVESAITASVGAAKVAQFMSSDSLAAGFKLKLATAPVRHGGRQNLLLLLDSRCAISVSICDLNSFRGAAQFGGADVPASGDLRQLLRPENNQGQKEQEDRLEKLHGLIIMRECQGGNVWA